MSTFIVIAIILFALVLTFLFRPLLRKTGNIRTEESGQTLSILREQRAELDADLASGRITEAEHGEGVDALARRLVEEETRQTALQRQGSHRILAICAGGLVVLFCGTLYATLGNPAALDPAKRQPTPSITSAQIVAMVDKLATRVAEHPEDAEARLMLSRSYMVLGRYQDAATSYEKLAAMQPDNAEVLASWADAVANAGGGHMTPTAEELIARALKIDPDNVKALALAGTAAFERADYTQAIALWERMSSHVDPQSETGQSARAMIAEAQRLAGASASPLTASGTVSLDPALKSRVSPQDIVFIFARPAAGGPPLAAIRLTAGDLPAHFDLAGAPLMTQAPSAVQGGIVIVARISRSGGVTAQSGDLQGNSETVRPDAQSINIMIDKVVSDAK